MSQLHVAAVLVLTMLALPISSASAQVIFGPGMAGGSDRSNPGSATEDSVPTCHASGGGSRTRKSNCEVGTEPSTVRHEQELKISIEIPALQSTQCSATTTTEYLQLNTIARVNSKIQITDCTAASGTFTIAARVRDESGEDKQLEFNETWERSDDQEVQFTADYPIGENVELRSVRVRGLRCTCADGAPAAAEVSEVAALPAPQLTEQ